MTRMVPYPLLTVCLVFMWLLLNGFSAGHLLLGTGVALLASWAMAFLQPERARIRVSAAIPRLLLIMLVDIVRSNIAVGRIVLSRRPQGSTSGFITVPLDIRSRYSLAALALIITATPGTLWMEYDPNRNTLLIHVLDLVDKEHWVKLIKGRYERLLMEIFE